MRYVSNTRTLDIVWAYCDPAGIVWNPRFFEFFDTATWSLLEAALGIPKQQIYSHYGIFGVPIIEAGANFQRPLKFGDKAEIVSTISEIGRSSFKVSHKIVVDGKIAVDGMEKHVWTVRDTNDPARIHGAPIPPEVIAKLTV